MKKVEVQLPAWIATHASLGDHVDLEDDIEFSSDERFWYYLTLFCPLIFESYALVLHPFWIKNLDPSLASFNYKDQKNNFKPLNWPTFFQLYNQDFNLENALRVQEQIRLELLVSDKWPENIWFPAEGSIEEYQIQRIRDVLLQEYGDIEVSYYYVVLKTHSWETDITYRGRLSELESLWLLDDLRDSPSAIYPDSKEWCIVTNYDSEVTYIGGTRELIKSLTSLDQCDIYEIEPKQAK